MDEIEFMEACQQCFESELERTHDRDKAMKAAMRFRSSLRIAIAKRALQEREKPGR